MAFFAAQPQRSRLASKTSYTYKHYGHLEVNIRHNRRLWFAHCLNEFGIETANRMNKAAIQSLAKVEIQQVPSLHAKESAYLATLAICNVPESSIVREASLVLMTRAGLEIGGASTKAFTTQLVALQLLVLELAQMGGQVGAEQLAQWVSELNGLPGLITHPPSTVKVGTMSLNFTDCNNALLTYSLLANGAEGDIAITRVIPRGRALCEELTGVE